MYFLGLDLGQKRDYSAVVVVERIDHRRAFAGSPFERLIVRYAERLPLGTPYPGVVERVREIVRSEGLLGDCALAVDATGVGAPVVDMLRAARLGCDLSAVTITGGDRANGSSVPKRDLMAEVLMLLEQGHLKIGKLREGPRLVKELTDVRASAGRVGADGAGEHDDLVIALALACWRAKRREFCGEVGHRLPGI
jgi:threonine dehydrogenase-like Zn-dependent dehydrogenase